MKAAQPHAQQARFYQRLQTLASQPEIEYALATASLSLLEGIRHMKSGESSKRAERAYSRLLRYLLRMCNRPTPFGLFAGIAIGNFAEETSLQLTAPALQRARTRPDMNWLFKLIQQVEQTPEVVAQLQVITNPTIHRAGGRATLPCADIYGQSDARTFSIRITPPIQFILENVSQPILYTDLLAKLLARFPHATSAQIEKTFMATMGEPFSAERTAPSSCAYRSNVLYPGTFTRLKECGGGDDHG